MDDSIKNEFIDFSKLHKIIYVDESNPERQLKIIFGYIYEIDAKFLYFKYPDGFKKIINLDIIQSITESKGDM